MLPLEGPSPVHLINLKEFQTDEKLEGDSVNKVLLLSSLWIVSSGYLPAFVNVCFTQQIRRQTRNKFTTHAGADGGVGRLQQHAD